MVWFAPAAICVTFTFAMDDTWRGTSTSIGVQPPWPSSPLDARPQVSNAPFGSNAAQCDAPAEMTSIAVGSANPTPLSDTAAGEAASSYPPWPSWPWNPRPKVYSVRPLGCFDAARSRAAAAAAGVTKSVVDAPELATDAIQPLSPVPSTIGANTDIPCSSRWSSSLGVGNIGSASSSVKDSSPTFCPPALASISPPASPGAVVATAPHAYVAGGSGAGGSSCSPRRSAKSLASVRRTTGFFFGGPGTAPATPSTAVWNAPSAIPTEVRIATSAASAK